MLTGLDSGVNDSRADSDEREAFVLELSRVLGYDQVQGGLGDGVGGICRVSGSDYDIRVCETGGQGDDLLDGALAEEREEGVDGVHDSHCVCAELGVEGECATLFRSPRRTYGPDEVILQALLTRAVENVSLSLPRGRGYGSLVH